MPQLTPKTREEILAIGNPALRLRWQRYFNTPADLQNTLFDQVFADKVGEIIDEKYHLGYKSMTTVAKIIGLIFLGELPIKNFIAALKNDLNVDVATAQAIAQDINLAIFQPVRESLMEVHGLEHDANQRMNTNDTNRYTNIQQARPAQPIAIPPSPSSSDYEAQQRREELLNKIKSSQNNPPAGGPTSGPPQARPASYTIPRRNTVDLRHIRRRNKYNGFFSS